MRVSYLKTLMEDEPAELRHDVGALLLVSADQRDDHHMREQRLQCRTSRRVMVFVVDAVFISATYEPYRLTRS